MKNLDTGKVKLCATVKNFEKSLDLSATPETSSMTISLLSIFFHPLHYYLQYHFPFYFEKNQDAH